MKLLKIALMTVLAGSLAGCVLNEQSFNANRKGIRDRPDLQAQYLAWCENRVKYTRIEMKRDVAGFMHTSMDGLPQKVCGRMLRGYLSGRMQYADLLALTRSKKFTPGMISILRAG